MKVVNKIDFPPKSYAIMPCDMLVGLTVYWMNLASIVIEIWSVNKVKSMGQKAKVNI
jgi:hypothetical protein